MMHTTLGRTGLRVSRLGFGAMRLPMKDGQVDRELAIPLFHRAFELGINLVDTAVGYCNSDSESAVGEALQGWRDRIIVSTKNHYYGPDQKAWWTNLENSLERLRVDAIDIYNLHGIRWEVFEKWVRGPDGILKWARQAQNQGLVRHVCCSFHDSAENLRKIGGTGEFESVILQYSLLYRDLEPVLPFLNERGIAVMVMGPVGGGRLGGPSEQIRELLPGASSTAEVALRFVLANPNVNVALSGMSEMAHVEENCGTASRDEPLSSEEKLHVEAAMGRYKQLADLYCTGCDYCLPCPAEVQIPRNFTIANLERVYGLGDVARHQYGHLPGKASYCIACGACEEKCPQGIPIRQQLRETARRFDEDYGKILVHVRPEALALSRDRVQLTLQLDLHNFSDQEAAAEVSVSPRGDQILDPPLATVPPLEPFTRATARFELSEARRPGFRGVSVAPSVSSALGTETSEVWIPVAESARMVPEASGDRFPTVEESTPLRIGEAMQVIDGDASLLATHGLLASVRHDAEAMVLSVAVRDDCLRLAPRHDEHTPYDGVSMMLDWRRRSHPVAPRFADGVFVVSLHPSTGEGETAFAVPRRGLADVTRMRARSRRSEAGYELAAWIPFAAFGVEPPAPGSVIGFDLGLQSVDAGGKRVLLAVWSGNPRVFRNAQGGYLFFT